MPKLEVHTADDDLVKGFKEQHSLEALTQPGSRLDRSSASRCTIPPMNRARSARLQEGVFAKASKTIKLATAAEAKVSEKETAEQQRKNAAASPEHSTPKGLLTNKADEPYLQSCSGYSMPTDSNDWHKLKAMANMSGISVPELLERFDAVYAAKFGPPENEVEKCATPRYLQTVTEATLQKNGEQ